MLIIPSYIKKQDQSNEHLTDGDQKIITCKPIDRGTETLQKSELCRIGQLQIRQKRKRGKAKIHSQIILLLQDFLYLEIHHTKYTNCKIRVSLKKYKIPIVVEKPLGKMTYIMFHIPFMLVLIFNIATSKFNNLYLPNHAIISNLCFRSTLYFLYLNPRSYIYYALFLPTELSSWDNLVFSNLMIKDFKAITFISYI